MKASAEPIQMLNLWYLTRHLTVFKSSRSTELWLLKDKPRSSLRASADLLGFPTRSKPWWSVYSFDFVFIAVTDVLVAAPVSGNETQYRKWTRVGKEWNMVTGHCVCCDWWTIIKKGQLSLIVLHKASHSWRQLSKFRLCRVLKNPRCDPRPS